MKIFQRSLFQHPTPRPLITGQNAISCAIWRKKTICLFLAVVLFLSGMDGTKAYAGWVMSNTTVAEGASKEYDDLWIYNNVTFQNSGTVKVTTGFTMFNNAVFTNDGTFQFTGSASSSSFSFMDSSSFINNGTATISGVYNFGIQEGVSFINTGTLFLENIQYYNLGGFTNNGIIVLGDNIPSYLETDLMGKNSENGEIYTKEAFENKKVNYAINYEIPYDATNNNPSFYEYAAANPQTVTLNNPERNGYEFLGWSGLDMSTPTLDFTFSSTIQQDITLTAHWQPKTYQITYELDGGSFPSGTTQKDTYTVEDGNYQLPQPQKPGYIFTGWTGANGSTPEKSVSIPSRSIGDKTFTANFIASTDTKYYVICYYQNIGGGYTPESHLSSGKTGDTVRADGTDYNKKGFTFDPDYKDTLAEGSIASDSSLQLKLYYSRNKHTVTYKTQDGSTTLWETEKFYGEKIGEYGGKTPTKESGDSLYTYVFDQWARYENLDSGLDFSDFTVEGDITFYAAFQEVRDENTVVVRWSEYGGFQEPELEVRLQKGSTYTINLELESEKYYIGTEKWGFPTFAKAGVTWRDPQTGEHPVPYEVTMEGFGKPVTLTIPDVQHDISLIFEARYHEEHDFSESYDEILTDGGCITDSVIQHFCYKCGKTCDETIPAEGHAPETFFTTDGTSHWKTCRICGEKLELAAHIPDGGVITKKPTHDSTGTKTYSCTVCGYVTGRDELPVVEHTFGNNWECNADFHFKICECGEQVKEAHTPDQGTILQEPDYDINGEIEYKCTVCGYVMGSTLLAPLDHEVEEVWQMELSGHWKNCACGKQHNAGAHISDGGKVISLPTATSAGTKIYSCTICGYVLRTETTPATGENPGTSPTPTTAPVTPPVASPTPTTAPVTPPAASPTPTTAPVTPPAASPTPTIAPATSPSPTPSTPFPWYPNPDPMPTATPVPTLTPMPTATQVPSMTPSPTVAPSPTPALRPSGPQAYPSLRLYYGGDATGKYPDSRYAVVWNKEGCTVQFTSENPEVATVNKRTGLVTAIRTGTAKIRITFTDQVTGEKTIKTCRVTVKRNAVDAGISSHSADMLLQLQAGETFQTKVWRADSDGNVVWRGRTQITDGVRFTSSNPDVFTVGKNNGKVTAIAPGEAILMVWAVQTEGAVYGKDGNVIAYRATTTPRFYRVSVE